MKIDAKKLHHAYVVEGERGEVRKELEEFLVGELKVVVRGNPDFWAGEFDVMGIDEARMIAEMQTRRAAVEGAKKIFIIAANGLTREAQNSLLKVFEEPTPDTHFFLIMPSAEILLPTLRSRLSVISPELGSSASKWDGEAEKFLKAVPAARLEIAKDMATDVSDEDLTKADAISFLNSVESLLHEKIGKKTLNNEQAKAFQELIKMRDYLNDRAPSVKMILEHLSLVLPQV